MSSRKPNLLAAIGDLGFAIGAGAVGAFGLGWEYLIGVVLAHVVFWWISRQSSLRVTPKPQLAASVIVSVGMIALVDVAAFLIASLFRG
ncbi:MAG: hypothetical protein JNJ73_05235 [Hyphomonadaceae bacterium]|nr:hypothetical protein [Hyphomonadaceae bacterium]